MAFVAAAWPAGLGIAISWGLASLKRRLFVHEPQRRYRCILARLLPAPEPESRDRRRIRELSSAYTVPINPPDDFYRNEHSDYII